MFYLVDWDNGYIGGYDDKFHQQFNTDKESIIDDLKRHKIDTVKIISPDELNKLRGYKMRFIEIEVTYPSPDICCYQEYKGKPYYSIKYEVDGEFYVGFGTYNQKVLSRYIKEYFIKQKDMLPKHFNLPRSASNEGETV